MIIIIILTITIIFNNLAHFVFSYIGGKLQKIILFFYTYDNIKVYKFGETEFINVQNSYSKIWKINKSKKQSGELVKHILFTS